MSENRKRVPPPPEGFVWAQDYRDDDGKLVKGIASRLGISYNTYRKWRMRGEGPPTVLLGKRLAARITWVEHYVAQKENEALASFEAEIQAIEHSMRPAESRLASAA